MSAPNAINVLQLLKEQGPAAFNQWRRVNPRSLNGHLVRADLRGLDLTGVNFRRTHLAGADLSNAILDDADLEGADLRGAVFDGKTHITLTRFINADIRDARLLFKAESRNGETIIAANFTGADLRGVFLGTDQLFWGTISRRDSALVAGLWAQRKMLENFLTANIFGFTRITPEERLMLKENFLFKEDDLNRMFNIDPSDPLQKKPPAGGGGFELLKALVPSRN